MLIVYPNELSCLDGYNKLIQIYIGLSPQLMTVCKEGESAPLKNAAGPVLALFLLLLIIAIYQIYVHRSLIKFYYQLYIDRRCHRKRSFSTAFDISAGLRGIAVSVDQIDAPNDQIKPRSFTIDIGFRDLNLTLKSVRRVSLDHLLPC